ncbi:Formin-2 [Liparis tanakae]|uniref:Formin-2 n=1 Tax=Liparis tanakae TaxID=230148 RepID=A0A4Z2I012_9TELE|nr:Formin-2 [Liparis tanakae]
MHTIKTVETQVPFLKESFFTSTFKGRRKSSVSNLLHKQQQQQSGISKKQQQHPKQCIAPLLEDEPGQLTPERKRLVRSTSSPLCKTAERAKADGDRKEGQKERKDQRVREAAQGRGEERGVRGSEPAAVSASPLLFLSSSSELGEAASVSQLPITVVGRQQGLGGSDRALTTRETASAAAQEEEQRALHRPQQYGLLAKGVRLFKNMGNQEAKQKKGGGSGGAAGDASCECDADEREADKKSKKSHSKISKGGGEQSVRKKSRSESKGSVFSGIRIRKSFSKAKGSSKDDTLVDERSAHSGKAGPSADETGARSDVEGDVRCSTADSRQSLVDEIVQKTSSGSDADLYSFHSAAENEDLLADIQQTMRNQCVATSDGLELVTGVISEGSTSKGNKASEKVWSHQLLDPDQEGFSSPVGAECVLQEPNEGRTNLENDSGSSGPGSPCGSGPTSSAADSSGSFLPKTNSSYSFPDTTPTSTSYASAEEDQDDLESPVLQPQGNEAPQTRNTCVPTVCLDPSGAGAGPMGCRKSASSMDLSLEREEETGKRDFLSLKRRKSSLSISQLTDNPPVSQSRRTSSTTSPSTVKLYPPVHPSYVKTTTRQLTSPISSPVTSPNVPRKTIVVAPSIESNNLGFRRNKQRSCSVAGPLSESADWQTELDKLRGRQGGRAKVPEQETQEKSPTGGTYWTLGSRRAYYGRQTSTSAAAYLDVFSGESHTITQVTKYGHT